MPVGQQLKSKSGKKFVVVASTKKNAHRARMSSKKAVTKLVKKVINGKAETKMVAWYNGAVAGTSPVQNSTGLYEQATIVSHNQFITSNNTDILKVIPNVVQGTADNNRNGRFINSVSGQLKVRVMISPVAPGTTGWMNNCAYDLTAVCYLLQSVTYKTYRTLYAGNDFTKLLDRMDGQTASFDGTWSAGTLPVEKGYYKLLGKKTIYLRSSGVPLGQVPTLTQTGNINSHKLVHDFTWNYGKHLPKKLVYPEESVAVADGQNEPLNSSLFWCVGYYNTDGTAPIAGSLPINIGIEYTSILKYKDM